MRSRATSPSPTTRLRSDSQRPTPEQQRKPRYRIHDLHSASEVALRLVLDPMLHRYASLILGDTAVATQSLYFEYGSQQALHRDSTVVPAPEFGRLVAAWIALADIAPESGRLAYAPGSQKFPFYEFGPSRYVYDPTADTANDVQAAMAFYSDQLERRGLPVHEFIARRGQVLIWHSALMPGGAMPTHADRTRKSLIVRYSTLRNHPTREGVVRENGGESVFTRARSRWGIRWRASFVPAVRGIPLCETIISRHKPRSADGARTATSAVKAGF
jgi:ectoine hydroxylase-related dioxygenase (phytanoyl-CoA dioxygenase family)